MPEAESGALRGMRVIELAGQLGEWCGRLLAGMGADVIKVEPPEGEATRRIGPFAGDQPHPERSLYFWHNNTGKRSLTLDLAQPQDLGVLCHLLEDADIFLEALPPGEARARGVDYKTLAAINPRLIVCSITPFGQDGPYAGYRTTDLIAMALGGPMQSCGYDASDGDLPPVRPGPYHSFHTVGHFACGGILAALFERELSGLGQQIDVAVHDCLAMTVEFANTAWYYSRSVLRRQTGRHAAAMPGARTQYRCADGRYINLSVPYDPRGWAALVGLLTANGLGEELDDPSFATREGRLASAGTIYDRLQVLCALHGAEELFHLGQQLGFTWGAVRAPENWIDDEHAAARGLLVELEHPELGRSYTYPGAPFITRETPFALRHRAPLLAEHSQEILAELRSEKGPRTED